MVSLFELVVLFFEVSSSKNKGIDSITRGTILFNHEPIQVSQFLKKFS